jgi:uncharacterized membrane protein YbhN (UPF0104 family)
MQALALGTGAAVVAVATPTVVSPWQLLVAVVLASGVVWLLGSGDAAQRIVRLLRPAAELRPLSLKATALGAAITLASWVVYGISFWLLANGLLSGSELGLRSAVGVFSAGYIVGFLAVFAPGGIGVREAVFVTLLAPRVGSSDAVVLAVGSRLLLTLTELAAAVAAGTLGLGKKESTVDAP